jgi:hypothetical protein
MGTMETYHGLDSKDIKKGGLLRNVSISTENFKEKQKLFATVTVVSSRTLQPG